MNKFRLLIQRRDRDDGFTDEIVELIECFDDDGNEMAPDENHEAVEERLYPGYEIAVNVPVIFAQVDEDGTLSRVYEFPFEEPLKKQMI